MIGVICVLGVHRDCARSPPLGQTRRQKRQRFLTQIPGQGNQEKFLPRFIVVEIQPVVGPPILYGEYFQGFGQTRLQERHHWPLPGCSVAAFERVLEPRGYRMVGIDHEDAFFVHYSEYRDEDPGLPAHLNLRSAEFAWDRFELHWAPTDPGKRAAVPFWVTVAPVHDERKSACASSRDMWMSGYHCTFQRLISPRTHPFFPIDWANLIPPPGDAAGPERQRWMHGVMTQITWLNEWGDEDDGFIVSTYPAEEFWLTGDETARE